MQRFLDNLEHWNYNAYRNGYPDVRDEANPKRLLEHALTVGVPENRDFVFDPKFFFPKSVIKKCKGVIKNHGTKKVQQYVKYDNNYESVLIINSIFGLGNRLRAIASAYSICKNKNMKLIINWIPDEHCECLIDDLIINISEYGDVISNPIDEDSLINFKCYNYLETENGGKKGEYIDDNRRKIYVKSNTVLNNKDSYLYLNDFFQSLIWNESIYHLINSVPNVCDFVGMHIRMEGGKDYQFLNADKSSNWTNEETRLMFKYREISHIDNFINQINKILHDNPEQKFFIATDMKCNYEKLINIYGNDKIKVLERNKFDRSKYQLYYAVADIILLSTCRQFYGSTWSSFSELVTYFQNTEVRNTNVFSHSFKLQNVSRDVNLLNQVMNEGNSIVCVSMNRNEHILKVLPAWLDVYNCNEIVILDYGSRTPLLDVLNLNNFNDPKIKVFRVENVHKWHLSKAYNLAIKLSSYKNIYKLDSDDICDKNLINNHPLNKSNIYYHGRWQDARNNNELQIAGKMFFTYDMFVESNGYNENITTYGWDDCEFDIRLNKIGTQRSINIHDFIFIEHHDNIRQDEDVITPKEYIHINRLLCNENILFWNDKSLHSEFVRSGENWFYMDKCFHLTYRFINKDRLATIMDLCKTCRL